jgi:predicted RNA-binding protein YlxR (DUF448 family)
VPGTRRKHIPIRRCIACQQSRAKRELVRIVRTVEGTVEIDGKGKRPGRGAYLCRDRACWESGLRQGKLSRALKCALGPEDAERLRAQLEEESLLSNEVTQ